MSITASRARGLLAALAIYPLVAVVVFGPFLGAPFIFDDIHTIRDNPYLAHHLSPAYYFKHPEAGSAIPSNMIRPILTWTYALDFHRAGPDPRAFRTVNLGLLVLNAWLFFGLCCMTRKLQKLAFWGGLMFLVHPLASVQIGCVSNRSVLLSSAFYLAALLIFAAGLRSEQEGRMGWGRGVGVIAALAILYAAGLFTKAAAATLPAVAALWGIAFTGGARKGGKRRGAGYIIAAAAVLLAVFGAYLFYRRHFSAAVLFPAARPWGVWQYGTAQARAFWTYARLMFFPVNLSLDHGAWMPVSPSDLASAGFILSVLGLAALAGTSLVVLWRLPEAGFAGLFSLLYLLPTSSVIPLVVVVNENRPYLSLVLMLWPLLILLEGVRRPKIVMLIAGVIVVCLAAGARHRGQSFVTEVAVWRDAVEKAPEAARPHVNLGSALLAYGRPEDAERSLRWALQIDSCSAPALNDLGNVAYARGSWREAEGAYRRALDCDRSNIAAMLNLADLLMQDGRESRARPLLERALALDPMRSDVMGQLGLYYVKYGTDWRRGLDLLRRAAELAPSPAEADKWRRLLESYGG